MKTNNLKPVLLIILLAGIVLEMKAGDPLAIIQKMDRVIYAGEDQTNTLRMILTDRNGNERVREARVWQKGTDKRLFRFTAPAAEAGIAFLSLPDDVMYIYMPAFGRERRIASHVKNQSFAGTDFTYEDLEPKEYAKTYTPQLIDETENKYILELTPLPSYRSDYSKLIVEVSKDNYSPHKMDVYDKGGNLAKTAVYQWGEKDGLLYAKEIFMRDVKRNHSTRMEMTNVEFNKGLDEQIFTVRNLGN
jgi:outer membrane lipoprotein-sorting protein